MRSYDDPCGVARALAVLGERWALLVVRELLLGPKRFADLSRGLPTMSQNVLAQRLRELERSGVVEHRRLGPPTSARVYELTDRGRELDEILLALGRWGSRQPLPPNGRLSVDALMLALRTTYDPDRAGHRPTRVGLRLDADQFVVDVDGSAVRIVRGAAGDCAAVLTTDPATLRDLVFGGRAAVDAETDGRLTVTGDRHAAETFLGCFPRPPAAAAAEGTGPAAAATDPAATGGGGGDTPPAG